MHDLIKDKVGKLRAEDKGFDRLCEDLANLGGLVVAFSGGVDSTFLLAVASEILGEKAIALTVHSPYIANWEIDEAKALTSMLGVEHVMLEVGVPEIIENNPVDRCYLCKGVIFSSIKAFAASRGIHTVADGSNADDTKDYRPGMRALKELAIASPLLENGITKDQIRSWSKTLGLETWDKPPYACLLTRLPYGTPIVDSDLRMIEAAEHYLIKRGIRAVRVRKHGDVARIEVDVTEMHKLLDQVIMKETAVALKALGFAHVALDLEGYTMGSFNKEVGSS